ncbi:hypothetical protein FRC09_018463, partial [Ceratobasidium sp. 395]
YLERGTSACRRKFASVNWFSGSDADATTEKRDPGASRKDRKASLLGKEGGRRKSRAAETAGVENAGAGDAQEGGSTGAKKGKKSMAS